MSSGPGVGARLRGRDDIHVIAAVLAVAAWGVGPVLNKSMEVDTPAIVFYRMVVGVPMMVFMAQRFGTGIDRRLLRITALPGVLFSLSFITGFASVKMTSIANATLVTNLQPVHVLLVAPKLFGERLRRNQLLLGAVSMAGVLTVVLAAASTSGAKWTGDVMAAVNVVIWTGYFLLAKQRRVDGVDSWSFLAGVFLWASVVVLPFGGLASNDLGAMTTKDWLCVIGMALGPGIIGHGLMTWSQSHVDVTLASILGLLSPVISTALAWVVFGESLTFVQLIGATVVIWSLAALVRSQTGSNAPVVPIREEI
ncbi:MAG: DMT family transporter [Actinomycetota bacterium]